MAGDQDADYKEKIGLIITGTHLHRTAIKEEILIIKMCNYNHVEHLIKEEDFIQTLLVIVEWS